MTTAGRTTATVASIAAIHGDVQAMPVSFAQRRFWVLDQLDPDSAAYTIPIALRLTGALDVATIEKALNAIVARHEALRTLFALDGEEPVQIVLPSLALTLEQIDLRSLPDAAREEEIRLRATANANASFDLSKAPLFRASLLKLRDDEHVLLIAAHHIVFDGWSTGVLYAELQETYAALYTSREPSLEPLALQYPDYAIWQRKVMQGAKATKQIEYWTDRLRALPLLDLATDRPRPPVQTSSGAKREIVVVPEVNQEVRAVARRENATPYMGFLATFVALLRRYTSQSDVIVGAITSGRQRAELQPLIGLFLNTLAIRTDLEGDPTFAELVRHVRDRATEAYANQDVPFERVVEAVQPERDQSRSAIFQVAFQLLEGLGKDLALPGVTVKRVVGLKDTAKFDLTLMLHEAPNGAMRAVFEYNTDLFDGETIDRMLGHYTALLRGVGRTPDVAISKVALLGPDETTMVTSQWNATTSPLPDWTTPSRVLAAARATPDAIAVRANGETLTYRALAERSAHLAQQLAAAGVVAGDRVGVCVDRTPLLLVALLGVHRAGAAYVPVDSAYPADRIAHVLSDAGVRAVVTDAASANSVPATSASIVRVESATGEGITDAQATAAPSFDGITLAYVIYTSGSTGKPKGVMVPHRALANFLASMSQRPGLSHDDALIAVTTIAFDIAGLELWLPLVNGARIELVSRDTAMDGVRLAATIADVGSNRKVMLQATPATWRLLIESGWKGSPNLVMLCGGEAWPPGLAGDLLARGAELWNVYGPTETTIWSTRARITAPGAVPLGEPIANTTLYALERSGEPAPIGVPGELWIGGAGLANGYWGREDLTAERFVNHRRFGVLYRTGDLVVRRANGILQYLGRIDDQVKVRGHRIELGEIEAVLAGQPSVSAAVVVVRAIGNPPEPQLVAYVVSSAPQSVDTTNALVIALRAKLPEYMVPAVFVRVDALPLTPNGKVDRRALPTPTDTDARQSEYVAPRNETETLVVERWGEVLGRARIGVMDDFFASGGNSLAATRVAAKLADALGFTVPVRALFEARTPSSLAEWIVANKPADVDDDLAALMAEIDSLSDEEARALLAGDKGK